MQTDSFLIPSVFWGAHCKVLKHLVVTEIFMSVFHYVCISFALSLSISLQTKSETTNERMDFRFNWFNISNIYHLSSTI